MLTCIVLLLGNDDRFYYLSWRNKLFRRLFLPSFEIVIIYEKYDYPVSI